MELTITTINIKFGSNSILPRVTIRNTPTNWARIVNSFYMLCMFALIGE